MKLWTSDDLWLSASRKGDPVFAMENGEYMQMTAEEFVVDTKTAFLEIAESGFRMIRPDILRRSGEIAHLCLRKLTAVVLKFESTHGCNGDTATWPECLRFRRAERV